jgi:hypothetical protein
MTNYRSAVATIPCCKEACFSLKLTGKGAIERGKKLPTTIIRGHTCISAVT